MEELNRDPVGQVHMHKSYHTISPFRTYRTYRTYRTLWTLSRLFSGFRG